MEKIQKYDIYFLLYIKEYYVIMAEPKLRMANKAVPPYEMNKFPAKFIERFSEEIALMLSTKQAMSLEGNEWERIFAYCIDAK